MMSTVDSSPWSSSRSGHKKDAPSLTIPIRNSTHSTYRDMSSSTSDKETSKSTVSRAIHFGSPLTRDSASSLVKDQMDSMRWCDRSRWGFDFYNESPVTPSTPSGSAFKYEWKKQDDPSSPLNYSYYGYKTKSGSTSSLSSLSSSSSSGNKSPIPGK